MAKINSADIESGNLLGGGSDTLFASLHSQTDQSLMEDAPLPRSPEGQEIFSTIAETLLGIEDGDGLDAITIEADGAVGNGYDDQLDLGINELLDCIIDDIEDSVERQFLQSLNFSAADLERVSDGKLNETLMSQAAAGLPSLWDTDAFKNLLSTLRDRLPQFVGESLLWQIDTSELTKFLSAEIKRFSVQEFLPQVARNICDAEVMMSNHMRAPNEDTLSGGHTHG